MQQAVKGSSVQPNDICWLSPDIDLNQWTGAEGALTNATPSQNRAFGRLDLLILRGLTR